MKVAVLLTCHNRKLKTIECLRRFNNLENPLGWVFEVFLVDDGSTDGTKNSVLEQFPHTHVIEGTGKLFWNRGMCLAWEKSREYDNFDGVIWLNDDTMLYENALAMVQNIVSLHPESCVVATIESAQNKGCLTYGGLKKGLLQISTTNELKTCDTFNGNFVFIPKCVSDKIGYLDPYYRHSVGDFDYSRRATRAGIVSYVTPIIGSCERNSSEPNWNRGTLIQRFKKLYSPLGNNPLETFYTYKQESIFKAMFLFVYIHIRVLITFVFPKK